MNKPLHCVAAAALAVLAGFSSSAWSQTAGSIVVRAGLTQISPSVTSGNLSAPSFAGTQVDIGSDTQPTGGITYFLTDRISVDIPLALGFTHDIVGAGAIAGVGKIGETKALPVTALFQYRFNGANDKLRPYIGAGPTYAKFYKERTTMALTALTGGLPATPTSLHVDSKWAPTVQVGVSIAMQGRWSFDAAVMKTKLKTRSTLSTGQSIDVTLDPTSVSLGVGYRF